MSAELKWLQDYQGTLPFYLSLRDQLERKGSLSPKQWECITRAVAKENAPPSAQLPATALPEIVALINRHNKAKYPAIRFLAGGREFKLTKASERARFPGSLNVVELHGGAKVWLGRIQLDGRLELVPSAECGIVDSIRTLATDPEGAAREYGRKTGHCCFCYLPLEDARSLLMGYGPICAKNYHLAWGERPVEERDEESLKEQKGDRKNE